MDDFTIRVTPAMLVSASTDISKSTDRMKSAFSEMSSMIQRTAGYWTGDAAELHRALFEDRSLFIAMCFTLPALCRFFGVLTFRRVVSIRLILGGIHSGILGCYE